MPRHTFIARQAAILDDYFALAPGEDETRHHFERLALDTYDSVAGKVVYCGPFVPYPSAFNFAYYDLGAGEAASPDLRQRWRDWKDEYSLLLERRPVLELRDALHTISESHLASSWPYGLEAAIQDWVDAGDRYAIPFEDRYHVATPEFYERLRQLRKSVDGWLYWDEAKKRVVLASQDDWRRIRAEQQSAEERNMQRIFGAAWEQKRAQIAAQRREWLIALEAQESASRDGSSRPP